MPDRTTKQGADGLTLLHESLWMAVLVVLALMLGTSSVRPVTVLVGHLLLLALGLGGLLVLGRVGRLPSMPRFGWLFVGMGLFALLQLLPLPPWLLALISPPTDAVYHEILDGFALYGQGQWMPLSQDLPGTLADAARWFVLWLVFWIGGAVFSGSRSLHRLGRFMGLMVLGFAALGFLQKLFGTDKILFLVPFQYGVPFFFSTFVNPNNFVGFLLLGAFTLLVRALVHNAISPRFFWLLMFAVVGTAALASLSLGGLLSLSLGVVVLIVWVLLRPLPDAPPVDRRVVPASFAFLLFGAYLALEPFWTKISSRVTEKEEGRLFIWRDAWSMIADHPWFGVGGGSFGTSFSRYQSQVFPGRVMHPENLLMQVASEYGLLLSLLLLLAMLAALGWLLRRSNGATARALTVSLMTVLVANLFDFSLNQLAVAAPFALILGALLGQSEKSAPRGMAYERWLFAKVSYPHVVTMAFAGVASLVIALGSWYFVHHAVMEDQRAMHALVYNKEITAQAFEEQSGRLLLRHPVDGWLHLIASERYSVGDRAALAPKVLHLQKAARLMPYEASVERVLGRAYALVGMAEPAIQAHKRAMEKTPVNRSVTPIFNDMLSYRLNEAALVEAIPPQRIQELAGFLFQRRSEKPFYTLLSRWTSQDEDSLVQREVWAVRLRLRDGKKKEALALAKKLVQTYPRRHEGKTWLAYCFRALGRTDEAYQALEASAELGAPLSSIWEALVSLALQRDDSESARRWADRYFRANTGKKAVRLVVMLAYATIYEAEGDYTATRYELNRAVRLAPDQLKPLERLGDFSYRQKTADEAVTSYERALALPEDSLSKRDRTRLETKLGRAREMQQTQQGPREMMQPER